MDRNEFIEATNRLEHYYEKQYSTEQLKIMFEELKDIDANRYKLIVTRLIRTSKFLPKIADIVEMNNELPRTKKEKTKEAVNCERCGGTGYLLYKKKVQDSIYEYACLCPCGNGEPYRGKEYYIPHAEEIGM